MGGDPDRDISVGFVAKEVRWGWRETDGTPKPQAFFLEGGPHHMRVRWVHSSIDEPVELWSELDQQREEVRKIEIWSDGRIGYAFDDVEVGGTRLGESSIPQLNEIAADPQFEPEAISRSDFEKCWTANVR